MFYVLNYPNFRLQPRSSCNAHAVRPLWAGYTDRWRARHRGTVLVSRDGKKGLNAVNVKVVSVGPADVMTEFQMDLFAVLDWYFPVSETTAVMDRLRGWIDRAAREIPEETTQRKLNFKAGADLSSSVN